MPSNSLIIQTALTDFLTMMIGEAWTYKDLKDNVAFTFVGEINSDEKTTSIDFS